VGAVVVRLVGAGDAFGSGGRFQACTSVQSAGAHLLLDCGATSLVALKRQGVEPNTVETILLSHLHGDHFGGIPFFVLDAQFRRRERPLLVAGPPGTRERVLQAMEVFFPGSARVERRFELRFLELAERVETAVGAAGVTAYAVAHPSGAPAYALRLALAGRVIAFSGDTAWSEALVEAARDADLFVCEAYSFERAIPHHLGYATLRQQRERLLCRRLILTHPGPELLARRAELEDELAEDGLVVTV
jgi:ribonuclease BN (tRNA processing enzyme)